ncbi:MAG: hypothetical protein JW829_04760 [Pirellulales bacterium]|nr:hypothetical protein [Pirellulales bacterium]
MFYDDDGLFLTRPRLAIDVRRRQPRAFVSHAHADHIARHALAFCTPATARFYQHRLGRRPVFKMPYRVPIEFGDLQLVAYPSGHCLGSAMLLVDNGNQRLLYTGDFKLGESATAERCELPQADILIMESTFGIPRYRMPPREETIGQLVSLVLQALDDGRTPVLHLYALGKSQEVTRILTDHGIPVLQHPEIFAISQIYETCGVLLGNYARYEGRPLQGHAVVTSPMQSKGFRVAGLGPTTTFTVTGWAMDARTKYRLGVDHAIPLSDHADFNELFDTVGQVGAREIYCTHGPYEFVEHLRDAGFNAHALQKPRQERLF